MVKEDFMNLPTSAYILDIHMYMKFKESRGIHIISSNSELSRTRDDLINWTMKASDTLKLSKITQHLGIYLIDRLLIRQRAIQPSLINVAIACLVLAAKFEGDYDELPKLEELLKILDVPSTKTDLIQLEMEILRYYKFEISWPTVADFGQFYSIMSIIKSDKLPYDCSSKFLMSAIREKLMKYLDLAVKGSEILTYRQSQIAACCLYLARYNTNIRPPWPNTLVSITGYTSYSLRECLRILMKIINQYTEINKKRKFSGTDSDYDSSSPDYERWKLRRRN